MKVFAFGRSSVTSQRRRKASLLVMIATLTISLLSSLLGAGQDLPVAKAAARSTDINFVNKTAFTLQKVDESLDHGEWNTHPPDLILPGASVQWSSESNGVLTGTEGRAKYILLGSVSNPSCLVAGTPLMELHWDNPYIGSNSYDEAAPAGFVVDRSGGGGNNTTVNWTLRRTCLAADTDGDGLPDDWEANGVTIDLGGGNLQFVNLPAMGADPNKPDIFIHMDWMDKSTADSMNFPNSAVKLVVDAFANAPYTSPTGSVGINMHIDHGPNSILNPTTNTTWGSLSRATSVAYSNILGSFDSSGSYDWRAFQLLKDSNFTNTGRTPIFHYMIAAYNIDSKTTSGISRNPGPPADWSASDFIISVGGWRSGKPTDNDRAGSLMHELGHNLGLRHGGDEDLNYKPNYVSVMNYAFQVLGVTDAGKLDYSRVAIPDLDETGLNETLGLGPVAAGLQTAYFCPNSTSLIYLTDKNASKNVNWNCDAAGKLDSSVAVDVDGDGVCVGPDASGVLHTTPAGDDVLANNNIFDGPNRTCNTTATGGDSQVKGVGSGQPNKLHGYEDWSHLKFRGGVIGVNGAIPPLPLTTQHVDITFFQVIHQAPPVTILTTTGGTTGNNGWLVSPATITLSATDYSTLGLDYTEYSFDTISWVKYTGPVTLGEGITTVYYRSKDKAGNLEHTQQRVFKIDLTAPVTSLTYTATTGKNGWLVTPAIITLKGSDVTSQVDYTEYSFDTISWFKYSGPFTLSTEGLSTLYYRSVDRAGNVEKSNQQPFKIDTRKPASSIVPTLSGSDSKFAFTITDPVPGSGPYGLHYIARKTDGSTVSNFVSGATGLINLSGEISELEFWAEDIAGNLEAHHILKISWERPALSQLSDYQALGDTIGQRDQYSPLANLVDNQPNSYWRWRGFPKAIALQIKPEVLQTIAGFKLSSFELGRNPNTYFQYSQDGKVWSDIPGLSQVDTGVSRDLKAFFAGQAVTGNYFRIVLDNTTYRDEIGFYIDLQLAVVTVDGLALDPSTNPAPILASHRLAVTGATASGGDPQTVLDGQPTATHWRVEGRPGQATLKLDLGQNRKVTGLRYFDTYTLAALHTTVEYSADGTTWTALPGATNINTGKLNVGGQYNPPPYYGVNLIGPFVPVEARYIRFRLDNPEGEWAIGGYGEIDVLGY